MRAFSFWNLGVSRVDKKPVGLKGLDYYSETVLSTIAII